MRFTICLMLASLWAPLQAQETTKVFEIRHAEVTRLQNLLSPVFRGHFTVDATMRVMIVRAPQEIMPAIEDAIKRFDVPPPVLKNIELTAYLLVASEQADVKMPGELAPVVKQLKAVFSYPGYRLLETLVLRSREGAEAEVSGVAPLNAGQAGPPAMYRLNFRSARIASDEKGRVIWLEKMRLGVRVPIVTSAFQPGVGLGGTGINPLVNQQFNYIDTGINADVDVREGQKVVVGKATIEGPDKALFLVLMAKVAE